MFDVIQSGGGGEISIQCMLDEVGDCPSRWLYVQFAEHHSGPAPGQIDCPRPKSHISPLYSVLRGAASP